MEAFPQETTIRILVKDSHKRRNLLDPTEKVIWHPLEQLIGSVVVQSRVPLIWVEMTVQFKGSTRVWTKAYDGEGAVLVLKKEYEFLSLAHKALTIESIENSTPAQFGYIAPYRFLIPPRVLAPSATVPDQCLYLPPSLLAGQVISGNKEVEKFAQPHVAYYVALKAVFRTSETSEPETREAWEEIKLVPYTEKLPPVETDDFPAEFVHSMTHNFRVSMFSSTMDTMSIALGEPSVIQLGEALCTTDLEFSIDVEATASERSTKRTDRLARCLEMVSFEIEVMLRAKTFYSTVPFPRIPGQTMLTLKGNLGLNDQILKLDTVKVKPARWSYLLKDDTPAHAASNENSFVNSHGFGRLSLENSSTTSATSSTIPPGKWNTTVRLPISVPSSLLPTFCSAIVARQYSLLLRVNASSVNIKSFVLEVPVQIIYPLPDDTDGIFARRGLDSVNPSLSINHTVPRYFESLFRTEDVGEEYLPDYS